MGFKKRDFLEAFKNPERCLGLYPIIHDIDNDLGVRCGEDVKKPLAMSGFWPHLIPHITKEQLDTGYGGIVTNGAFSREYLKNPSEFQSLRESLDMVSSRGMKILLYDERGYPSGSAGGLTLEEYPEGEAIGLFALVSWQPAVGPCYYRCDIPRGKFFKALAVRTEDDVHISLDEIIDTSGTLDKKGTLHFELPEGRWQIVILFEREYFEGTHAARSYSEERRYINLMDNKATEAFLNVTHETYYRELKDMFENKHIIAFFNDEASLMSRILQDMPMKSLPWKKDLPEIFYEKYGYDIHRAVLAELYDCGPETAALRCDFWELVSSETAENYFGRIRTWCNEHSVLSAGHLMGEENVFEHVALEGSYYMAAKEFDIPGIDLLSTDPELLMQTHKLPIGRLAASVADVYGAELVMTEASDYGRKTAGEDIPEQLIVAALNWQLAQGVNFFTSYFDAGSWSPDFAARVNEYVARTCSVLTQGAHACRVALLYPESSLWAEIVPTEKSGWKGQSRIAEKLKSCLSNVSWGLIRGQVDFEYIDENSLIEGSVKDGMFSFNSRCYSHVILPMATTLPSLVVDRMVELACAGGKVYSAGCYTTKLREKGESLSTAEKMKKAGVELFDPAGPDLPAHILKALPSFVRLEPYSPLVMAYSREDGDFLAAFLANMGGAAFEGKVSVQGEGGVSLLDPFSGGINPVQTDIGDGFSSVELSLEKYRAVLLIRTSKSS